MKVKGKNNMIVHASELIPSDPSLVAILKMRAEILANQKVQRQVINTDSVNYLCFKLGVNELYGIHYDVINEIVTNTHITSIPALPPFIKGVINWRGKLITVLNLAKFFNLITKNDNESFILIVHHQSMILGILVNDVEATQSYDPATLAMPLLSEGPISDEYILGLHNGKIAIVNIDTVIKNLLLQLNQNVKKGNRIGELK